MRKNQSEKSQKIAAIFKQMSGLGRAIENGENPMPFLDALKEMKRTQPDTVAEAMALAYQFQQHRLKHGEDLPPAGSLSHPFTRQTRIIGMANTLGYDRIDDLPSHDEHMAKRPDAPDPA